jgi:hypothetical protein
MSPSIRSTRSSAAGAGSGGDLPASPGSASVSRSVLYRSAPRASAAISSGVEFPSIRARSMVRPDTPNTPLATEARLMLQVSSNRIRRLHSDVSLSTSLRRYRTKSRRARCHLGGTKLLRTRPCLTRSAIHSASFTSVLRPGTFLMCVAFPTTSSKSPSSTAYAGIQYTTVDSIPTFVHPSSSSQRRGSSSSLVDACLMYVQSTTAFHDRFHRPSFRSRDRQRRHE